MDVTDPFIINATWRKLAFAVIEKHWGREDWLVNTPYYCAKVLTVHEGQSGSYHYHPVKCESFLVLSGEVALLLGKERIVMERGDRQHIPASVPHLLFGLSKWSAQVLEVSTHHSDADVVRLWPHSR